MSELDLTLGGEEFRMTRENTSLFTFLGESAMYNHIFFQKERLDGNRIAGTYLFRPNPNFTKLRAFMEEHHYPMHINLLQPAQCDLDAFNAHYFKDLNDISYIPDEWEEPM